MVDIFDEVEEQLREEKYRSLATRALPWVTGLLALALVGALGLWGWTAWSESRTAKSSEQYDEALLAFQSGNTAQAFSRFGDLARDGSSTYKSLALNQQGGIRLDAGSVTEAVSFFDKAAEASSDPLLKDLARLKSAYALMDSSPYAEIETRLLPLTDEDRPLHLQAREALAFAKLQAGRTSEAKTAFQTLSTTLGVPDGMEARASAALSVIDSGSAAALPGAIKAALALPKAQALPPAAQTGE